MAARRDNSGIFDAELKSAQSRRAAVLDNVSYLSEKGMTFVSDQILPEWTEVGVEMRMPVKGARKDKQILCRGVVVQCTRRTRGKGYEVSLLFVDLPKTAHSRLSVPPSATRTLSVSIAR